MFPRWLVEVGECKWNNIVWIPVLFCLSMLEAIHFSHAADKIHFILNLRWDFVWSRSLFSAGRSQDLGGDVNDIDLVQRDAKKLCYWAVHVAKLRNLQWFHFPFVCMKNGILYYRFLHLFYRHHRYSTTFAFSFLFRVSIYCQRHWNTLMDWWRGALSKVTW